MMKRVEQVIIIRRADATATALLFFALFVLRFLVRFTFVLF